MLKVAPKPWIAYKFSCRPLRPCPKLNLKPWQSSSECTLAKWQNANGTLHVHSALAVFGLVELQWPLHACVCYFHKIVGRAGLTYGLGGAETPGPEHGDWPTIGWGKNWLAIGSTWNFPGGSNGKTPPRLYWHYLIKLCTHPAVAAWEQLDRLMHSSCVVLLTWPASAFWEPGSAGHK